MNERPFEPKEVQYADSLTFYEGPMEFLMHCLSASGISFPTTITYTLM